MKYLGEKIIQVKDRDPNVRYRPWLDSKVNLRKDYIKY